MLEMLPYPSGEPHIGHLKNYSVGDAVAHFRRRQGMRVLHPMGYDAFGLPAENHAISTGQHPRESTDAAIASFQRQFREWGISIDWSREFGTHEPRYYRWTQWIFLQLFERGLAYRKRGRRQVVPQRPDRARQRAGHRRALRALRPPGRGAPARAVVLPHHRLRRPPARRPRHDRVARARQDDAAQLDRALGGRGGHLPQRGAGHRLPGLHDAPGHALRRDVLRHGARAPRRLPARRGHRAGAGGPRVRQPRADRVQRGARRRRPREDRRLPGPPRHQPRQRRAPADVRRRLRAHGVRDRRDHGRARPRRARPRVRAQVRPAHPRGRRRRRGRPGRGLHGRRPARELPPRLRRPAQPRGARARSSPGWTARARATRRSTTACATGCSRASATGAARSRSSTASAAGSSRCPRTSSPSCCPTSPTTRPRGARRWPRPRTGSTWPARRAAARRGARPTRWTPSSTRPGTSCATRTPTTTRRRGTPRCWRAGCRSTSTSAASSTRSCT